MNRQTRPSELTGSAIADCDVYLIECRSKDGSLYFPERDSARTNRADTICDIHEGQEENVVGVICFNTATFSSADVTEEIARDVLAVALADNSRVPDRLMAFIEGVLGCATVATAERELVS